jgi:hypothetical protein
LTSPVRTAACTAAEELLDGLLDLGHPSLPTHEDHLVDVLRRLAGVLERAPTGVERAFDEIGDEGLQLGAGEREHQVLRTARVRGDKRQIDLGLERRRELALGLLRGLLQALERHAVVPEVDAVIPLELAGDPVHDALVEVVAAQVRVAVRRLDLEDPLADLENRDVEGAAAEVVDRDRLVLLLVEAVGERGRGRLIDDPEHLEPRDGARLLGRLPLAIVEVRGHGDDGLRHLLAEVGLGGLLQLAQDHRGDLGRRVLLAPHLDARVAAGGLHGLVGDELDLLEHLFVTAPHEPLDGEDRVLRIGDGLTLRHLSHEDLAVLREADDRGCEAAALLIRDDRGIAPLHDRNDRVRRPEIDPDDLRHEPLPSSWIGAAAYERYRTSILISLGLIASTFGSLISSTPSR